MRFLFSYIDGRLFPALIAVALVASVNGCTTSGPPYPETSTASRLPPGVLLPRSTALQMFQCAAIQQRRFSTEATFTNLTQLLKIEVVPNLNAEGAQIMLDDGVMGFQALYANALSPYPGDISKEVVTDVRFRPELVRTNWNGLQRTYALVFANDRLGYGAMPADAVRHRALVGWFYCAPREVFYKVRCFLPLDSRKEELEALFLSLTCP